MKDTSYTVGKERVKGIKSKDAESSMVIINIGGDEKGSKKQPDKRTDGIKLSVGKECKYRTGTSGSTNGCKNNIGTAGGSRPVE